MSKTHSRSPSPFVPGAWPTSHTENSSLCPLSVPHAPSSLDCESAVTSDCQSMNSETIHSGEDEDLETADILVEGRDVVSTMLTIPWLWRSTDSPARPYLESPGLITPTATSTPLNTIFAAPRSPFETSTLSSDESSFLHSPSWETSFGSEISNGILCRQNMSSRFSTPLPMRVPPPTDTLEHDVSAEIPTFSTERETSPQATNESVLLGEPWESLDGYDSPTSRLLDSTHSHIHSSTIRPSLSQVTHTPTPGVASLDRQVAPTVQFNPTPALDNPPNVINHGDAPALILDALTMLAASDRALEVGRRRPTSEPVAIPSPRPSLSPQPKWKRFRERVRSLFQYAGPRYSRRNTVSATTLNIDVTSQRTYTIGIEIPDSSDLPSRTVGAMLESSMSWDLVSPQPNTPPGLLPRVDAASHNFSSQPSTNNMSFSGPHPPPNSPSTPFLQSPILIGSESPISCGPCLSTDVESGPSNEDRARGALGTVTSKEQEVKRKSHRFSFTALVDRIAGLELQRSRLAE